MIRGRRSHSDGSLICGGKSFGKRIPLFLYSKVIELMDGDFKILTPLIVFVLI